MKLIGPNLQTVYHEPSNESAREKMILGATFAGIAFSNSMVGIFLPKNRRNEIGKADFNGVYRCL